MKIQVLFFGILKDIVGKNLKELTINSQTSIADLKPILFEKFKGLDDFLNYSVAVNEEYVDEDYVLQQNDIVALIPPVSGG